MKKNKRLIAKIFNGDKVVMTIDRNMLSCEFGALDRGNLTDVVNWGIYANRGSISFIDNIGYFNSQNVHSSNFKKYIVKFYLAKNQETLIATFKVDTFEFDDETRRVDIQLIAKVIELQKQPSTQDGNRDVLDFYEKSTKYLIGLEPPGNTDDIYKYYKNHPSYGLEEGDDLNNLRLTYIYCTYLTFGTLWDRMNKICQASMCRIFDDKDGLPIISGERPTKTPIIVNPKNIISISQSQFVKVPNVSIDIKNRMRHTNDETGNISKNVTVNYLLESDILRLPTSVSGVDSYDIVEGVNERKISFSWKSKLNLKSYIVNSILKTTTYSDGQSNDESMDDIGTSSPIYDYDTLIFGDELVISKSITNRIPKTISYLFDIYCFEDLSSETEEKETEKGYDITKIESNDLIQTKSYYGNHPDNGGVYLGNHILNEVVRRYGKGRECFEIECLFNDYYDVNGNKVFDTNDLSNHFNKYDIIVPYVMKKGKVVPLRVNEDETPKQFRIIGISYSYDGLLKQKLSIQEDRYDVD